MGKVKNIVIKLIRDYPFLVLFVMGNLINAILFRLFTTGHFQLRGVLFDLCFLTFIGAFSFIIKAKRRKLYFAINTVICVLVCVINSLYYNYYASFASVSLLATSVNVKDVGDAVVGIVVRPCDLSYFWLLIATFIIYKKNKNDSDRNKQYFKKSFILVFIFLALGSALPPYNAFSRLYKLWNRVAVVDSFGPYVYQVDDIIQSLKPKFNNIFGYDKALKETKDYYYERDNNNVKNEYSDIFKGKNVLVIHAESLQTFTIGLNINDNEITPNLTKLANSGMYFDDFYAQVGVGTSSDSEFTYATGLLPVNNGTVFVNYYNNTFETMQNLLKKNGYYVFSMHGNVGDFWNREQMYVNIGYDRYYSKKDFLIDEEYGLGLSDASFFRQVVPKIKEISLEVGKPFYGTLITLTNHTPWKDASKFSDLDLGMSVLVDDNMVYRDYLNDTHMGNYLKSVNYMDKAIGLFIDELDQNGLLDDMVIVIYGDHDARLGIKQFQNLFNYDGINDRIRDVDDPLYREFNDYDYELMKKVPFIIWTKDMAEGEVISKPMGMIDAMPTLGNMLGVYNRYSLGHDIMNVKDDDAIVVLKDGSFITNKVYYSVKNSEAYMRGGVIGDDYITKRCEYADKIIEISDNIITYDLIPKLK